MSGFPTRSLSRATAIACWWRSSSTRQAPALKSPQSAPARSKTSASMAASASPSYAASYGKDEICSTLAPNRAFSGHKASTTSMPDNQTGVVSSSALPITPSQYTRSRSLSMPLPIA